MGESLLRWWPVALFLLNALAIWIAWSVRKTIGDFVTQKELAESLNNIAHARVREHQEAQRELHQIDNRLVHMEERTKHMPSHEDLRRVHKRMDDMNGELQAVASTVRATSHTVNLIHQHLMSAEKKGV